MSRLGRTAAVAAAAAVGLGTLAGTSPASSEPQEDVPRAELAMVRNATARYHDLDAAIADGYALLDVCFESEGGGMGYHYVKGVEDDRVDPLAPEALVYEWTEHGLRLVAVEYIAPRPEGDTTTHTVLGRDLHAHDVLPLWVLHAWIWEPNPDGMFADFNPNVGGCPET